MPDDPQELYRYMSLANKTRKKRVTKLFKEHKVWFSKPTEFNDPFEFHVTLSFEATLTEKIEAYAKYLQKAHGPTESFVKANAHFKMLGLRDDGIKQWEEEQAKPFIETMRKKHGILSLTKDECNILMWSHYADYHKGICLGLSPNDNYEENSDFWDNTAEVEYHEETNLPEINPYKFMTNPIEQAKKCILTKAIFWDYEAEWRTIDTESPGLKKIPEGIISSVRLGCCIEPKDRDFIIGLASDYPTPVKIFQAHKKPGHYELEFRQIHAMHEQERLSCAQQIRNLLQKLISKVSRFFI